MSDSSTRRRSVPPASPSQPRRALRRERRARHRHGALEAPRWRAGSAADRRGVPVSTSDPRAIAALDLAVHGLASHRAETPVHLQRALELDPGLVPALVLRGFAAKLLARRDRFADALHAARAARGSLRSRGGTFHEELLVRALEAWCAGDPEGAVRALDCALDLEPCDLLAIKLSHALQFMLGRSSEMRRSIERVLPAWDAMDVAQGRGLVLGCHAFSLVETGELARAERVGRAALEIDPIDPWGAHAVAHVLHAQGRPRDGVEWLERHRASVEGANNFGAHVFWHQAVMLVALGRPRDALALHDERVVLPASPDYRDLVNSATLLYRLERVGIDVGDRWQGLADTALARLGDHALGFADVHCVLALVGSGRRVEAERFVASMRAGAVGGALEATITREVAVPVAEAILALRGDPRSALRTLLRHEPELMRLGGSRAQREIFTLLTIDAADAAGVPALPSPLVSHPALEGRE